MGTHSGFFLDPEPLDVFLERHWSRLLAGQELVTSMAEVEDPALRFDCFEELSDGGPVRRYAMRLRDGSRIRAVVDERSWQICFARDRFDPAAGVFSMLRHAVSESHAARCASHCVAAFRLGRRSKRCSSDVAA